MLAYRKPSSADAVVDVADLHSELQVKPAHRLHGLASSILTVVTVSVVDAMVVFFGK